VGYECNRREIYTWYVGKPFGNIPLPKPKRRWKDNILKWASRDSVIGPGHGVIGPGHG